ncbi:MAG TPA: M48 family metallopeptidase [bacterium]|nr:M48 family metallopeptidase [bacterium]HPN43009.1 M48 family metallopeptidase [bacterium]
MNYDNIRIGLERQLSDELYKTFEGKIIKKLLNEAQIEPQKENVKSIFEGMNFKISQNLSPKLYSLCQQVQERLGFTDKTDYFIANEPTLNAFSIYRAEESHSHIIVLNSGLVEKLDDDELMFVLGHEIGHLITGNSDLLRIFEFLFTEDNPIPLIFYNKIQLWKKVSELTADRFGYIASPIMDKCVTNFFKLSSGLDTTRIAFSPQEYLAEVENQVVKMQQTKTVQYFDHPVNPVRVKALRLFSESDLFRNYANDDKKYSDAALNTGVQKLCELLYTIDDSEIGVHRKNFIAAGGLIIAGVDEQINEEEMTSILYTLANFTISPQEFLDSIVKSGKVENLFAQSLVAIVKMNPGERFNLFAFLIDIALADDSVNKGEIDLLFTLGVKYFGLTRKEIAQMIAAKIQAGFVPSVFK